MLVQTLWDSTLHMMNGPMFNGVHTGFMTLICFMIVEWHIYGFEWTEEKAVWTIDGETVRIFTAMP